MIVKPKYEYELKELRSSINDINSFLETDIAKRIPHYIEEDDEILRAEVFIKIVGLIFATIEDVEDFRNDLSIFDNVGEDQLDAFHVFVSEYNEIKSSLFGTLFKGKKIKKLNEEFKRLTSYNELSQPTENIETIIKIYKVLKKLQKDIDFLQFEYFKDDFKN